jgi:hypothetical protein
MKHHEAVASLRAKFTSGNSIPVERSSITREEFEALTRSVVVTHDSTGEIVAVSRQDDEGRILEVISEGLTKEEKVAHQQEHQRVVEAVEACKLEYQSLDDLSKLGELGAYHRSVEDQA